MTLRREVEEADLLVYGRSCPNCKGFTSDRRLRIGVPCSSCLPFLPRSVEASPEWVFKELSSNNKLLNYRKFYDVLKEYEDMVKFFKRCVGNEPWSIQRLWIKRLAKGSSFAMIAPTGVGKTTFGAAMALYFAIKGKDERGKRGVSHRSYFIVPTTALAMQLEDKLREMSLRAGLIVKVKFLAIHSRLKRRERVKREKILEEGEEFDILITTSNYLMRNFDKISKHKFRLIFVDDVDAVMKGSKAINYILKLMGFNDKDIEDAMELLKLKRELAYLSNLNSEGGSGLKRRSEKLESLEKRLRKLKKRLEDRRSKNVVSKKRVLVISSATGNPRGSRVRLFRELLGFEIGARPEFVRNITDVYVKPSEDRIESDVIRLVKRLGRGGLVYVPVDRGVEYAERLAGLLREEGIEAEAVHSRNVAAINNFKEGRTKVLVGVATYYGLLVRGIDLPEIIRYAVFAGVPRHKISLRLEGVKPQDILRLLPLVRDAVENHEVKRNIETLILRLRRVVRRASAALMQSVAEVLSGRKEPTYRAEEEFLKAYEELRKLLSIPEVIRRIKENPNVAVVEEGGSLYVLIPDAPTYIQASGRTSRLYLGGISKGLSIIVVDDERLLQGLGRRLRWMIDDFEFKNLTDIDLNAILDEIDRDRELIRKIRAGTIPKEVLGGEGLLKLKTALLVVESPNKARTIARFFGRPSMREYGRLRVYEANLGNYTLLITASGGHIYDLITNIEDVENIYGIACRHSDGRPSFVPIYTTLKKCQRCGKQSVIEPKEGGTFKCPFCGESDLIVDSASVVEAIRDVALEVDEVLIGTDPDTEGEKIAFDIENLVKPVNPNIRRVEFHEVTRRAIINAVMNPRSTNLNLVKAQLIRRIEDRWIGFSLSNKLQREFWRLFCSEIRRLADERREYNRKRGIADKDRGVLYYDRLCRERREENRNLSAGRVQTPVLGWIIEAYERHIKSKTLFIILDLDGLRVEIPIPHDLRRKLSKNSITAVRVKITREAVEEADLKPLPPYTTDTALYDISSKYGIPAPQAMQILQDLFELGFITYHRTDSTRVSDVGIGVAKEYMQENLGEDFNKYFQPRTWGEGGAHECIRPTRPMNVDTLRNLINEGIIEPVRRLTRAHYLVYDLIFRRFMASQAKPARVRRVKVSIEVTVINKKGREFSLPKMDMEVYTDVIFDGFSRFYRYFSVKPEPREGVRVFSEGEFSTKEWYREPLHTQASLVKMMKEREIGRPSTYAKIINTLFERGYVAYANLRGAEGGRSRGIVPLRLGVEVYRYLQERYSELVSESTTRKLEREMRNIEEGRTPYEELLNRIYEELKQFNLIPGGCR